MNVGLVNALRFYDTVTLTSAAIPFWNFKKSVLRTRGTCLA